MKDKKPRKKPVRKKLTEEQKIEFNRKCRATKLARYGSETYNNVDKNKKTKLERYGNENYNNMEKNKNTCLNKYGVSSYSKTTEFKKLISDIKLKNETQEKYEHTLLERYGATNVNKCSEIREKYLTTLNKNYGVSNPLKNKSIKNRQLDTLRQNGTFNTSKPEEEYFKKLCDEFGADDIIREYKDDRYPYNCDFYIKSQDKFIELNLHPSHGPHPFDENRIEDLELLESLKSKNDKWSNMIIDVWTVRDVKKRKCAETNNLNYEMIYNMK